MNAAERVPCFAGSALKWGACRMVKSGTIVASSSGVGRRNMLYANRACHGLSLTTRTLMPYASSAPARASRTKSSWSFRYATTSARSADEVLRRHGHVDLAPVHRLLGGRRPGR